MDEFTVTMKLTRAELENFRTWLTIAHLPDSFLIDDLLAYLHDKRETDPAFVSMAKKACAAVGC